MQHLECTLAFEGDKWILDCGVFRVEAAEWDDVQEKTAEAAAAYFPGQSLEIRYYFDMQSIPRWFHQYQNHYFNGIFIIDNHIKNETYGADQ